MRRVDRTDFGEPKKFSSSNRPRTNHITTVYGCDQTDIVLKRIAAGVGGEIGAGSGYQAAILSSSHVAGIERLISRSCAGQAR